MNNLAYKDNYCEIKFETVDDKLFIHVEILQKDSKTIQHCVEVWDELKEYLKSRNVDRVYALVQEDNNTLKEFASFYFFEMEEELEGYEIWSLEI